MVLLADGVAFEVCAHARDLLVRRGAGELEIDVTVVALGVPECKRSPKVGGRYVKSVSGATTVTATRSPARTFSASTSSSAAIPPPATTNSSSSGRAT